MPGSGWGNSPSQNSLKFLFLRANEQAGHERLIKRAGESHRGEHGKQIVSDENKNINYCMFSGAETVSGSKAINNANEGF